MLTRRPLVNRLDRCVWVYDAGDDDSHLHHGLRLLQLFKLCSSFSIIIINMMINPC